MFEIQFLGPMVIRHHVQGTAQIIVCNSHQLPLADKLLDFLQEEFMVFDSQPTYVSSQENTPVIWTLQQEINNFWFNTTLDANDSWRVCTYGDELAVAMSSLTSQEYGGWINPDLPNGGMVAEPSAYLHPIPSQPFLPVFATDGETINRWDNKELPFRVRQI